MHTLSRSLLLTFVPLIGAGCASVTGARFAHVPNVRTVTSIGDKPVSVVAGAMGESVTVGDDSTDLRVASEGQISGRVLDAQGRPAPNAEVRVAVGGASAGRLVRTRTDEAGGFTLHGLRPDASYTLIAEGDNADGPHLVGQQVARAPSRRVLISMADPDRPASASASARVRPASEASVFEDEIDPDSPSSVNEDDLFSPDEAPVPTGRRSEPDDAPEAAMTPRRGWRRGDVRALSTTEDAAELAPDRNEASSAAEVPGSIAEEVNPLPPALKPPDDPAPINEPPPEPPIRRAPEPAPAALEPEEDLDPLPSSPSPASEVEPPSPSPSSGPAAPPIPTIPDDSPAIKAMDPGFHSEPSIEREDPPPIAPAPSPKVEPPTIPDLPSTTNEPTIPPPTIPEPDPAPASAAPDPAPVEPPTIAPNPEPAPEASTAPDPAPSIPPVADMPPVAEMPPAAEMPPTAEPPAAELPPVAEPPVAEPPAAEPPPVSEIPPVSEPPAVSEPPPVAETSSTEPTPSEPTPTEPSQDLEPSTAESTPDKPLDVEPRDETPTDAEPPADAEEPKNEAPATVSNGKRPTWGEVDSRTLPTLASAASSTTARAKPLDSKRSGGPLKGARDQGIVKASCRFDARQRRLVDFQLPDLQGQPVHFKDLDADLVLIDFWGTWCGPCKQSIPHLVDLQNRFGPNRLKVVGVAYEQGTPSERTAAVEAAAHQLGINYTVLLGEADGQPCPLQGALNVQAYPTLILVDRHGRILWRDQGATRSTLDRLERVIASNAGTSGVVRR